MESKLTINEQYVTTLPLGDLDECKENKDFEKNVIMPTVKKYAHVCSCQSKRMMNRYSVTNRTPVTHGKPIGPVIRQEDIDTLRFGVVATVTDGKYASVATVIVQCSECKKLSFYGQLPAALNMFGIGISDFYSGDDVKLVGPATTADNGIELEDLESGEISPVPDSLSGLFGGK